MYRVGINAVDGSWHYRAMKKRSARDNWHFNDTPDARVKWGNYFGRCANVMEFALWSPYWKRLALNAGLLPEMAEPDREGGSLPLVHYEHHAFGSTVAMDCFVYAQMRGFINHKMKKGMNRAAATDAAVAKYGSMLSDPGPEVRTRRSGSVTSSCASSAADSEETQDEPDDEMGDSGGGEFTGLTTVMEEDEGDEQPAPGTPTMQTLMVKREYEGEAPGAAAPRTPTGAEQMAEAVASQE